MMPRRISRVPPWIVSFGAISIVAIGCGVGGIVLAFRESVIYGWSMVGIAVIGALLAVIYYRFLFTQEEATAEV